MNNLSEIINKITNNETRIRLKPTEKLSLPMFKEYNGKYNYSFYIYSDKSQFQITNALYIDLDGNNDSIRSFPINLDKNEEILRLTKNIDYQDDFLLNRIYSNVFKISKFVFKKPERLTTEEIEIVFNYLQDLKKYAKAIELRYYLIFGIEFFSWIKKVLQNNLDLKTVKYLVKEAKYLFKGDIDLEYANELVTLNFLKTIKDDESFNGLYFNNDVFIPKDIDPIDARILANRFNNLESISIVDNENINKANYHTFLRNVINYTGKDKFIDFSTQVMNETKRLEKFNNLYVIPLHEYDSGPKIIDDLTSFFAQIKKRILPNGEIIVVSSEVVKTEQINQPDLLLAVITEENRKLIYNYVDKTLYVYQFTQKDRNLLTDIFVNI